MNISKLLLLLNGKTAEGFPEVTAKATFRLGRGETDSGNLTFRMNVTAPIGSRLTVNYGDCRTQSDHSALYPDQTYESDGLPIEISASLYLSGLTDVTISGSAVKLMARLSSSFDCSMWSIPVSEGLWDRNESLKEIIYSQQIYSGDFSPDWSILPNLTTLNLYGCDLRSFSEGSVSESLERLSLSENFLTSVTISGWPSLISADISNQYGPGSALHGKGSLRVIGKPRLKWLTTKNGSSTNYSNLFGNAVISGNQSLEGLDMRYFHMLSAVTVTDCPALESAYFYYVGDSLYTKGDYLVTADMGGLSGLRSLTVNRCGSPYGFLPPPSSSQSLTGVAFYDDYTGIPGYIAPDIELSYYPSLVSAVFSAVRRCRKIRCLNNRKLSKLDVSDTSFLKEVHLENCSSLNYVQCSSDNVSSDALNSIVLKNNRKLGTLNISKAKLSDRLLITGCHLLASMTMKNTSYRGDLVIGGLSGNNVTVNVSDNRHMKSFTLSGSPRVSSVDVRNCTSLERFTFNDNLNPNAYVYLANDTSLTYVDMKRQGMSSVRLTNMIENFEPSAPVGGFMDFTESLSGYAPSQASVDKMTVKGWTVLV